MSPRHDGQADVPLLTRKFVGDLHVRVLVPRDLIATLLLFGSRLLWMKPTMPRRAVAGLSRRFQGRCLGPFLLTSRVYSCSHIGVTVVHRRQRWTSGSSVQSRCVQGVSNSGSEGRVSARSSPV